MGALLLAGPVSAQTAAGGGFEVRVLSTRADMVSGGDVLIQITTPTGGPRSHGQKDHDTDGRAAIARSESTKFRPLAAWLGCADFEVPTELISYLLMSQRRERVQP
jgi:hypothetical protein